MNQKVAIITGASRGIGKATAYLFSQQGFHLVLNARDHFALEEIQKEIMSLYKDKDKTQVEIVPGDITQEETRLQVVKKALDSFGRIDVLVNNAGGNFYHGSVLGIKPKHVDRILSLNYMSALCLSQLCIPIMIQQEKGSIINISSILSSFPDPNDAVYSSIKSAIETLTKAMAQEFGSKGLRINCVSPGYTETELIEDLTDEEKKIKLSKCSLSRLARVEEIAKSIWFLSSDDFSYCNGSIFKIDGGAMLSY
jgi:NAD(P)-dependent dehydrogenase (short-subunit alcohol dehydrogenase family)